MMNLELKSNNLVSVAGPEDQITYIPARCSLARQGEIGREGGEDHNDKFAQEQQEITDSFSKITLIKQMSGGSNVITCPAQPLELSFSQVTCRQHWQRSRSLYSEQSYQYEGRGYNYQDFHLHSTHNVSVVIDES